MVELPNFTEQTGQQHTVNSFTVVGVYYWTTVEWRSFFQIHHWVLDYGSKSYDMGHL